MMASLTLTFIFLVTFQANVVCISTVYGGEYTVLFYLAQPIANLFFSFFRGILIFMKIDSTLDVN